MRQARCRQGCWSQLAHTKRGRQLLPPSHQWHVQDLYLAFSLLLALLLSHLCHILACAIFILHCISKHRQKVSKGALRSHPFDRLFALVRPLLLISAEFDVLGHDVPAVGRVKR